jgi:site-specific recombinase XerD
MINTFSYLVTRFFTSYLATERGLSPNTIASYSDCFRLLVRYVCERFGIEAEAIESSMVTSDLVLDFLDSIEKERGNGRSTRNQRLGAMKSFFHFLARNVPELMHHNERIQAINLKSCDQLPPPSLTVQEVDAILASPDVTNLLGARDRALLQLMYNTGARVQELADLTLPDLNFESLATVTVTGKGRKIRVIPLWRETVEYLQHYLVVRKQAGIESDHLFLNTKGEPMTRFGMSRRLAKHVEAASARCPSLRRQRITPHVIRHSTALHLIEAGNDIGIVKDWLGHADMQTTSQYVEVSLERKRKALDKLPPPEGDTPAETPKWTQPDLMQFLTQRSRKTRYVA